MRCSEALHLDRDDGDLVNGVLKIRGRSWQKIARRAAARSNETRLPRAYATCRDRFAGKP